MVGIHRGVYNGLYMQKILTVAGVVLLLVGGFLLVSNKETDEPASAESVAAFQEELTTRGVAVVGQPIEGFDAFSLLRAFPGLKEADFAGVATFEGVYRFEEGELSYVRTADQPVTSAEQTVSEAGYANLLANVSARLEMKVDTPADARAIVDELTNESEPAAGEPITVTGQVTCLPKVGEGVQTLECALGLEAEDGSYYSLQTPADVETNYQFLGTGTPVEVSGQLTDDQQFGPDGNRYDTVGTIVIETIEEQ